MSAETRYPFELNDFDVSLTNAWEGASAAPFNLVLEGGSMRGLFTAGVWTTSWFAD